MIIVPTGVYPETNVAAEPIRCFFNDVCYNVTIVTQKNITSENVLSYISEKVVTIVTFSEICCYIRENGDM